MRELSAKLYLPGMANASATAWLVSDDHALTAYHCVSAANEMPSQGRRYFQLEFESGLRVDAVVAEYSADVDAALLRILDCRIDTAGAIAFESLSLHEKQPAQDRDDKRWTAWGYPDGRPQGLQISGSIELSGVHYLSGTTAIQLNCDQGGAGGRPLSGMSGAAVVQGRKLTGMISSGPVALDQRVIYAVPVRRIADALPTMARILAEHDRRDARQRGDVSTDGIVRRANLVCKTTRLYGRDKEVIEITDAIDQGARLVTLWGDSGCGKTRLAYAVGSWYVKRFNGVYMADLLGCIGADSMRTEIANTLGIKDTQDKLLEETLAVFIAERSIMLILDCAQQLPDVRGLIEYLLDACPRLHVLAVRERALAWDGRLECAHRVFPLALSERELNAAQLIKGIGHSFVLPLFADRARLVNPDFALSMSNIELVTALCLPTGGLPLAVELVAGLSAPLFGNGQCNLMQVVKDVTQLVDALNGVALHADCERLEAIIGLSTAKLDPDTTSLFWRLSVFVGGCTLEGAEQIGADLACGQDSVGSKLEHLVARGLLTSARGIRGKPYYRLQPAVLAYCRNILASRREYDDIARRQVCYYARLAGHAERRQTLLSSAELAEWYELLEFEYANLRNALGWAVAHPQDAEVIEAGLEISGNLFWFWNLRGSLMDGLAWNEALLPLSTQATRNRGAALYCSGGLSFLCGDFVKARARLAQSICVWEQLSDHRRQGFSLIILGMVALHQSQLAEALRHERLAVELFRALDDRFGLALAMNDLANVMFEIDSRQAETIYLNSLACWTALRNNWGIGLCNSNLGRLACRARNYKVAQERLAVAVHIQSGHRYQWGHAESLKVMGHVHLGANDLAAATRAFRDSFQAHQRLGRQQLVADCLDGLGKVAIALNKPLVAAWLMGAASGIRTRCSHQLSPFLQGEHFGDMELARADAENDADFDREMQAGGDAPLAEVSRRVNSFASEILNAAPSADPTIVRAMPPAIPAPVSAGAPP
jgi:predicted ATPase